MLFTHVEALCRPDYSNKVDVIAGMARKGNIGGAEYDHTNSNTPFPKLL